MVSALGGDTWLSVRNIDSHGRTAAFFQGNPTEQVTEFFHIHIPLDRDRFELTRKRDIIQIFTPTTGVEITYKGRQYLPQERIDTFMRARNHSVESIARVWMKDPSILVFSNGSVTVGRRQADSVRIIRGDDNVTLDLDVHTHLPLRCSYTWRDLKYRDLNQETEEFDNYQLVDGIQTPFSFTRYHNGDMVDQRYLYSVDYNVDLPADLFDPANTPIPAS